MGKIIEQKMDRFDGGTANDIRDKDFSKFAFTRNFDTLSFPHRLIPFRSYETGNDTLSRAPCNFLYYSSKVWMNGSDGANLKIFYKDTFTDGTWSATANATAVTAPGVFPNGFIQYKAFLFGFHGSQSIFKYDTTGAAAFVNVDGAIGVNITTTSNSVVHSKDDVLYMAFNNVIVSKSGAGGAWNVSALTLPTNLYVSSMCEYGNYLAIACNSTDPIGQTARVFLWDRDSSVTTLSESIDWGLGLLNVIETLDGRLTGLSLIKRETSGGLIFNSVLSAKYYSGNGAEEFLKIEGTRDASAAPISFLGFQKQKVNNRLYFFMMLGRPEGTQTTEGVWSLGRSGPDRPYAITSEFPARNSNASVPNALDAFIIVGSYVFVAYSDSGSLSGNVSKTDDAANFTSNSKIETLVIDGGDPSLKKKLVGVTVTTKPIPSGGQVVLNYRIDENIVNTVGNFNTIFTHTTTNSLSHSAINIESDGSNLPEFNELQLQVVSTGGAEITGISWQLEVTGKRLY